MGDNSGFIRQKGNFRELIVFRKAECIYDVTFFFTHKFLEKGDRSIDQMVQAARSGKQNIAEGCSASTTSTETEIKLINVARASLQELLLDYEDYLRVRNLQQWPETDERFIRTRKICSAHNDSAYYREAIESRSDETIANIAIILIKQADYLLRRYFNRIQRDFLHNGGIREEMSRARHNFIKQNK
jgi:four helix bundle suffix protein